MSLIPSASPPPKAGAMAFEAWIESLRLPESKVREAREAAARKGVALERILVETALVDYSQLGGWYAQRLTLPYAPIAGRAPNPAAVRALSPACARAWQVFPWDYEAATNRLIVAVHAPEQIEFLRRLRRFFLLPFELGFTACSPVEIADSPPTRDGAAGPKKPPAPDGSHSAVKGKATAAGGPGARPGATARRPGLARPAPGRDAAKLPIPAYADMARALLSTVSAFLHRALGREPERLALVRSRVRYCELVATRMSLAPPQTDGLLLAAWLSGFEESKEALASLSTPYGLEQILFPEPDARGPARVEAYILDLVRKHQQLAPSNATAARDVGLTRRELHRLCPGVPDAALETFLQILVDEQFLSVLDRSTGRILIVDPAETRTPKLSPPLTRRGYTVEIVADAEPARQAAAALPPDLILCELDLPHGSSSAFCQSIRSDPRTAAVPIVLVAEPGSEARAAESLRAGADDLLPRPVDMELLLLKIERCLDLAGKADTRAGISGRLSDMALSDMIQILSSSGRNMEIALTRGPEKGSIFLRQGEVVHAAAGDLSGAEAFYALLRWDSGEFTARTRTDFPHHTIREGLMSLLMESARRTDEARNPAAAHAPADA